ncbi:Zinc finger protein CONSTANS-LIKE 5 [Platanthera zijinensis]|uniref:Zinc finger protein CONSTANS-LIKE 5 n=1 Tax=Platanthera zijinensis TaxID=2320716 RepID=A0AAP0BB07_9ASPA
MEQLLLMEDMLKQAALFSIDQKQLYLTPPAPPQNENFIPQSPMAAAEDDNSYLLVDGGHDEVRNSMPFSRCGGAAGINFGRQVLFSGDVMSMQVLPEMMLECYCYKCQMEYSHESLAQHGYGINDDFQVFGNNNIHMVGECSRQMNPPAPDGFTVKIGRLSAEERKEKINRYMRKKSERNFAKKIQYACRKTLADSRHRVRGRFAKNGEFSDAAVHNYDGEEEEEVMMKEEELMFNSSGILSSDSEVNSFQYNYTLQSWM